MISSRLSTAHVCALFILCLTPAVSAAHGSFSFEVRSLDGSGNNRSHPSWGQVGTEYQRLAPARYADGSGALATGPNPRYISNRVFNSLGVDLFSERNVSQWAWVWGQFLDHTFGLAQAGTRRRVDPVQRDRSAGALHRHARRRSRSRATPSPPGPAQPTNPRQQINTVNSYIDALGGLRRQPEPPGLAARRPRHGKPRRRARH